MCAEENERGAVRKQPRVPVRHLCERRLLRQRVRRAMRKLQSGRIRGPVHAVAQCRWRTCLRHFDGRHGRLGLPASLSHFTCMWNPAQEGRYTALEPTRRTSLNRPNAAGRNGCALVEGDSGSGKAVAGGAPGAPAPGWKCLAGISGRATISAGDLAVLGPFLAPQVSTRKEIGKTPNETALPCAALACPPRRRRHEAIYKWTRGWYS